MQKQFFSMFTLTHKNCSFFRSLCYACKGLLKPITHTQIKCASLGFYWLKEVKNVWNSCHQKIHGSKMMRNLILSIICLIISFSYTLKSVISSDDLEHQWSKMNKKNLEAMPLAMLPTKSLQHCQDQMIRAIIYIDKSK